MPTAGGAGGVRIGVAFGSNALDTTPTWTYLTATPNLTAGYTKDSGRQFEFDKTDAGTATVTINDPDGVLDPTNTSGPHTGNLEPLRQIQIELLDPTADTWHSRFRGWIEDFDYAYDPTQLLGRLTINCVDMFAICTAIEMQPVPSASDATLAAFGQNLPSQQANGNIYFWNQRANERCNGVLGQALIPPDFYVVFEMNVNMLPSTYSPSENVLQVIQDAADAEFPMVANVFVDRFGRLCVHGRQARFDPLTTVVGADWIYRHFKCGDGVAVAAHPGTTAQIRELAFNRGLSKIKNSALCVPNEFVPTPARPLSDQYAVDTTSLGIYGYRSWSAENLFVQNGILTGYSGNDECLAFAQYVVDNYAQPRDRITVLGFRSMAVDWTGAAATWDLLTACDIGDRIDVTSAGTGSSTGGFNLEPFFIEGVHESVTPLNPDMANVTLNLDVSPMAYFPPGSPLMSHH